MSKKKDYIDFEAYLILTERLPSIVIYSGHLASCSRCAQRVNNGSGL